MPSPTVTSVSPPTGIITGGTVVNIRGSNFAGTTGVTFDGVAATTFTAVTGAVIYAIVPAHAAGVVDVAVTNGSGTGTGTGLYTFTAAASPAYNIYLWDDCCHNWFSTDTGASFREGATPGSASTPAPNDSGLDPYGNGTLQDPWSDAKMAINDADYLTLVGIDFAYAGLFSIIASSPLAGQNLTYTLLDPEPNSPAFVGDSDHYQNYLRGAISSGAETILLATYYNHDIDSADYYPRISRDSGATWADVTGVTANITWSDAAFGSTASQIMYLKPSADVGSGGISPAYLRKSTNWGVAWSPLSSGPDADNDEREARTRLRCSADGQTVVKMANDGDFWLSTDGGSNWTNTDFGALISTPGDFGRYCDVGVTPDGGTIIVSMEQVINSGNWPAVFVSTNGGTSFTDVSANIQYPASIGAPAGGAPGTISTGCTQCNVAPDGLGMVVTFRYFDSGVTEPDGLTGAVMYANVSTDAGATFTLVSMDADPYETSSVIGLFTAVYMMPFTELVLPEEPSASRRWQAMIGPLVVSAQAAVVAPFAGYLGSYAGTYLGTYV